MFDLNIASVHDEQQLRQLCNKFSNGKLTLEEVKSHDFHDEEGRGKRKRIIKPESSSDEDEPLRKMVLN